jgi:hypothetical protein
MNELFEVYEAYSLRLAQTLLHFLWQGAAIGALVFLLDRSLKMLPARSKYALHVAALVSRHATVTTVSLFIFSSIAQVAN